jgi:hypothetical protein
VNSDKGSAQSHGASRRRRAARRPAPPAADWSSGPTQVLTRYAERGVFRSFTALPRAGSRVAFCMRWHKDQNFDFIVDRASETIRVPVVLPNVAARSAMDRAYRRFLEQFQNGELPEHRSIDRRKCVLKCINRLGSLSVAIEVHDGDYAYATEKLLAVIHETYLLFLQLGGYADYMVQHLGANPDWGK